MIGSVAAVEPDMQLDENLFSCILLIAKSSKKLSFVTVGRKMFEKYDLSQRVRLECVESKSQRS